MRSLVIVYFTHHISQLQHILQELEVDLLIQDELLAIEPEDYLATQDISLAILTDEDVSVYWSMLQVSDNTDNITEDLALVTVDENPILLFNANDFVFLFVNKKEAEQADDLVNSLL